MTIWEKSILDRGTSQCKGSEVGAYLECSRDTGEASTPGAEAARGKWVVCEVKEVGRVAHCVGVSVSS